MSLAIAHTRAHYGLNAPRVTVEVHISSGLPKFMMVGLPETVVKESKDRVRSAIQNSGFEFPLGHITVNLAPAELPKMGSHFDLAMAVGILAASQQIPADPLAHYELLGELALTGELRPVKGALPAMIQATKEKKSLIVSHAHAGEAQELGEQAAIFCAHSLSDVCQHWVMNKPLPKASESVFSTVNTVEKTLIEALDFSQVQGQAGAKRVLEIAASGGHSVLMVGSPGTGKSMLAERLPSILPPPTPAERLETAAIYSFTEETPPKSYRPFRRPHHLASAVAVIGGGQPLRPGEISLAHHGVLFLDELPEFNRQVLEGLREPLEAGAITIARAKQTLTFPARFQWIAAMNPCPCGYAVDRLRVCRCTPDSIQRYQRKLSGPLLDRIDLYVPVQRRKKTLLSKSIESETSAGMRQRVIEAYERQWARQGSQNARLSYTPQSDLLKFSTALKTWIEDMFEQLKLSMRAQWRCLKVARTIADLADSPTIEKEHALEALSYRIREP